MVGQFIAQSESDPARPTVLGDDIQTDQFRFLTKVESESGSGKGMFRGDKTVSVSLVKPLGLYAFLAWLGLSPLEPQTKHPNGIGQFLCRCLSTHLVHAVAGACASQMGQPSTRDITMGRFGVIHRWQYRTTGQKLGKIDAILPQP